MTRISRNKYFAYGSNMDQKQMSERCPDSRLVGKAFLKDYRIAFTIFSDRRNCGCADIIKSAGNVVWGLLYEISDVDLDNLDKAEGHPIHYRRFEVNVTDSDNKEYVAETYEVADKQGDFIKPSKHYLGIMQDAAVVHDFPAEYRALLGEIETTD